MKIRFYPKLSKIILISLLLFNFLSCEKEDESIPFVRVNFDININSAEFSVLQNNNSIIAVTGGWAGIIIYHEKDSRYYAYERGCPYEAPGKKFQLKQTSLSTVWECPECKTKYELSTGDGWPIEGPGSKSLKHYNANLVNSGTLRVSNGNF